MAKGTMPGGNPPTASPADLERAGVWLKGHGLSDVKPTPLLATRLAVRRRSRLAASVLLAVFLIAVALTYVRGMVDEPDSRRLSLFALTAAVVGLVLAQSLLDWWVRRVDRRVAASLPRRAAYPVRLGWRTVLGRPRATFAAMTFGGAIALALGGLSRPDSTGRFAAVVLLIGLCGTAVRTVGQLRHTLTQPVVADDEVSLAADVIMRVEDARDTATPTVVWPLPIVSVFSTVPGWWNAAWLVFVVLSVFALALITARTPGSGMVARHVVSTA